MWRPASGGACPGINKAAPWRGRRKEAVRKKLYVCVSLDVEEEGLFGGHYERARPKVDNIALLPRLAPISREYGLPLTLFCAYSVFADISARKTLDWMRGNCKVEIGAHLHHWNTPPLECENNGAPLRTHLLQPQLLAARLDSLLAIAAAFNGQPVKSFRMGRWDLKAPLFEALAQRGIKVDSSICPLRAFAGGANHFLAPALPWWRETAAGPLLVAPVTQLPVLPWLARFWQSLFRKRRKWLDLFHFFGAMSANPFWHGSAIMRQTVKSLVARGGNFLNLFWHSSELMPGGSPQTPNQAAADRHLRKIAAFFAWLRENHDVSGICLGDLPSMNGIFNFPAMPASPDRDW